MSSFDPLVRSGRLEEIDRTLVAEALEDAAATDGPRWFHDELQRLMFFLIWPKRTYFLYIHIGRSLDLLRACLKDSPSMRLFLGLTLESAWQSARYELIRLDDPGARATRGLPLAFAAPSDQGRCTTAPEGPTAISLVGALSRPGSWKKGTPLGITEFGWRVRPGPPLRKLFLAIRLH